MKTIPSGCLTATATPFTPTGEIDWPGFERNLEFQVCQGIRGLLSVGTTGESPTLTKEEHRIVNLRTAEFVRKWEKKKDYLFHLAGAGSNNLKETIEFADAVSPIGSLAGSDGLLLVDPYYNGPSSFEIRTNYYEFCASRYPDQVIVPYIIPGRTGCALSEQDLAFLAMQFTNVQAVKEATGDLVRMKKTRKLAPAGFKIFSGDDDKTWQMMSDPEIDACGVISVISNIAPAAIQTMCDHFFCGNKKKVEKIEKALAPLFKLVTVKAKRNHSFVNSDEKEFEPLFEEVEDKFRNPVPIKTIMNVLGMPAGPCRPPLGRMLPGASQIVRRTLENVWQENKWILQPIEAFYGVNIANRIDDDSVWREVTCHGDY